MDDFYSLEAIERRLKDGQHRSVAELAQDAEVLANMARKLEMAVREEVLDRFENGSGVTPSNYQRLRDLHDTLGVGHSSDNEPGRVDV